MKTLRQHLLVLGALCGAAVFAQSPAKSAAVPAGTSVAATSLPNPLPPADPTAINLPIAANDPVLSAAGYHLAVESVVKVTRKHSREARWETYTAAPRVPAWFKCEVVVRGGGAGAKEFTFYEVGAQGRKHATIVRFVDPSKVTEILVNGVPSGIDKTKPFLVEPMLYWDPVGGVGSKNYTITFTGGRCEFTAVYADYWDVTDFSKAKQPGDGAPPPAGSGQEH